MNVFDLKLGDFVRWKSKGVLRWNEARRLVHLEMFSDGILYAFCDGSLTGIPFSELIPE